MAMRDAPGELEELGEGVPRGTPRADDVKRGGGVEDDGDAGSVRSFAVGSREVSTVRRGPGGAEGGDDGQRARGIERSFGKQVALFSAMALFGIATLIPLVILAWCGFMLVVDGVAATALLHSRALEPRTFGPAMLIGLSVAALLLVLRWRRRPPLAHLPAPLTARYPAVTTIVVLTVASLAASLAASTGSPFFPFPLATILVVATLAFTAVTSLVATARGLAVSKRWLFEWACRGHYRAGFVTAALVLIGAGGVWAQYAGRMAWPVRWLEREMEIEQVHGPSGVEDAGKKALCLAAGEISPTRARSAAAPMCSFLPGYGPPTRRDDCFETLVKREFDTTRKRLIANGYSRADAGDAMSKAALVTCSKEPLPDSPAHYFARVARNAALREAMRGRREQGCVDLEAAAENIGQYCRLDDTVELREAKLGWLRYEATCRLKPKEQQVVDLRLEGLPYDEIDRRLKLPRNKAKNTFNYAMDRLHKEIPAAILEACNVE